MAIVLLGGTENGYSTIGRYRVYYWEVQRKYSFFFSWPILSQKYCLNTRNSHVIETDTFMDYLELDSKPLCCLIVTSL